MAGRSTRSIGSPEEAVAKFAERKKWNLALVVALAAEVIYIVGRVQIKALALGVISQELAITGWRLVFVALYVWLSLDLLRKSSRRETYWHPTLIIAIAVALVVMPLGGFGFGADWASRIVFVLTTPVVALREELFYRVILQGSLERLFHPVMAILVSTAFFVPYHIGMESMNVLTVSHLISGSVLLGAIYQRTRTLWIVVILHALLDWAVLFPPVKLIEPSTVLVANMVVLFGALLWWSIDHTKQRMGI